MKTKIITILATVITVFFCGGCTLGNSHSRRHFSEDGWKDSYYPKNK